MKNFTFIFHKLSENPSQHMEVSFDLFDKIVQLVKKSSLRSITVNDFLNNGNSNDWSVGFSFDDGFESDYIAFQKLKENGLSGTFYIITDRVGKDGYLDWERIIEMNRSGMEIASHTKSHQILTELDNTSLRDELCDSKKIIEEKIGKKISGVSIPHGEFNQKVIKAVSSAGYEYTATSKPGINRSNSNTVNRISITKQTNLNDIINLLNHPRRFILNQKIQYIGRKMIKAIFGIKNYQKIRSFLIK